MRRILYMYIMLASLLGEKFDWPYRDISSGKNRKDYLPYKIKNSEGIFISNNNYQRNHHDKYDTNKRTRICQKGLEQRIENKKLKEEKLREEEKIQNAFSRKMKSRRWAKRHHDWKYSLEHSRIIS